VTPLRRFASSFTYWVVVSDDRLEKMFGVIGLAGMESGAELYVEGIARLASFVATLRDRERDALTKGVRQEVFWMDFRDCVSRAGLRDRPYSLLCIDLDKFKPVNDTHGHEAGDAVLRSIGQLIIETIRKDDLYGRVGGDEFCVAGEMTYDEANVLAGRIRDRVHSQAEKLHSVTCSIGVYSWWPTVTDDGARARRVADNASLAAKAARCPAGHTFSIRDHKVCPKCGAVPADLGGNRVIAKQSRSPRSTQRRGEQNA
jgi:diguanylate cyclase (GGDEF)-like protein